MRRAWEFAKGGFSALCWIALIAWSLSSIAQVLLYLIRAIIN